MSIATDPPLDFDLNKVKYESDSMYSNVHRCPYCSYFTKSTLALENHRIRHTLLHLGTFDCATNLVEPFVCRLCEFRTNFQKCYNGHIEKIHRNNEEIERNTFKVKCYTCRYCPFQTFSTLLWLKYHGGGGCNQKLKMESPASPMVVKIYVCEYCGYKSKTDLGRHILNRHTREEDVHWFKCGICEYKSKRRGNLNRHLTTHVVKVTEVQGEFKCDRCKYKGKTLLRLENHIFKQHDSIDVQWFRCTQCEYKTNKGINLRRHINSQHMPDEYAKWYQCDHCDFKTKHPDSVKRHVKEKHVKEREVPTPRKRKPRIPSLKKVKKVYKRSVPKERPFKCSSCKYRCTTLEGLSQHVQNQHVNPKWLLCDQCAYKTKRGTHLKRHINSQHLPDECAKWFDCSHCEYRTKYPENLGKHVKSQHSKER